MSLISRVGIAMAIVSTATLVGAVGKMAYYGFRAHSYTQQIARLESHSENPDQDKLAELELGQVEASAVFIGDLTVAFGTVIPYHMGVYFGFPRSRRKPNH